MDNTSLAHRSTLRRSVANTLKGSSGNLVEWFDVYVYSVFAMYFEKQFFSAENRNSTIFIWAIFAVTFIMRPLGSWVFGWFADRFGRRLSLTISVALMATGSMIVAITPTEATIGTWAAIILVFCRLLQGFATGGEYGTSATYMSEAAVPGKRGFLSSFHYVTLVGGHVLAQLTLFIMLTVADIRWIETWGWRVAFAIGGVGAIVVFWLRQSMDESLSAGAIVRAKEKGQASGSMRELLVNYWRELLICFLITMGGTVAFYTYTVNGPKIVQKTFAGDDVITGTLINLFALVVLMLLQPLAGWISDHVGRKTLLVFFGLGGVLYSWVMILVLPQQKNPIMAFSILIVGFIIITGYTSINAFVKSALFPQHVRALGVGFGYAMANSLFGGTSPLIYQASISGGWVIWFVVYVTALIALSLVVYLVFLRNRGLNWIDNEEAMEIRHKQHKSIRVGI